MEKIPRELDELLAQFPIDLALPWGAGWKSEIAVELTDGPALLFESDGRTLRASRDKRAAQPFCSMRGSTAQLIRLLRGDSLTLLLFEGLAVDRLPELLALQATVVRARRRRSKTDVQDG